MIQNYFKIAWRNIQKNKVYSFINIFGLAVGMAVALIIGLWILEEMSYDSNFKNSDKLAQVYQHQTFNGKIGTGQPIPRPLEKTLRENYGSYFKEIAMATWPQTDYLKVGEKDITQEGNFIQKSILKMLDLKILNGESDGLRELNSIMISETTAKALFGNNDPIGKIIKVDNLHNMKVTAVYENIPKNSSFGYLNFIMPWEYFVSTEEWVKNSEDDWGNNSFQMFVQVADNVLVGQVSKVIEKSKQIANPESKEFNSTIILLPMKDWHLRSDFKDGIQAGGLIENVWLFGIIGVFILILACINFMNLSTARSEKRAKEVGIRKSIGSERKQLIFQFLSESFLVVFLAFIVSIGLVILALPGFNSLTEKEISFPWLNPLFWSTGFLVVVFTALISGSYPALYLSSFQPIKVLKGTFRVGKFASIPRKVLVVMQFTVSVGLVIGTLIVMKQINHTKNRPIGYDTNGLIQVPVMYMDFIGKYDFMRTQILNSGAAVEMSSSSSPTTNVWSNRSGWDWEGKPEGFQEDFAWTEVSTEYAKSLKLKIVQGRDFSREMKSDSDGILINQSAVKYMGLKDPIGKFLTKDEGRYQKLKIVGVIEDMIMQSPYAKVKQMIYAFDKRGAASYYNIRLNPEKSATESLTTIQSIFKKHFPDIPYSYQFVDKEYERKFADEEQIGNLTGIFTILAIFISCLGLFGLASFVAEQRTKEIGIRKVLGATVTNLWAMLSRDFVLLVIISCLISAPIAYYFMNTWLEKYTYRTDLSWWIFAVSAVGALVITLLTVSFQAIKAALLNPVKSLKSE